jgi:hypothetical protein
MMLVDADPLHRLTTASRRTLASVHPAPTWDVRRFRPNLVIAATDALEGLLEANGHGRTPWLGEVVVPGGRPTARHAMTIQAQGDLPHNPTIAREAGEPPGIDASLGQPGRVLAGDVLDVPSEVISPRHARPRHGPHRLAAAARRVVRGSVICFGWA